MVKVKVKKSQTPYNLKWIKYYVLGTTLNFIRTQLHYITAIDILYSERSSLRLRRAGHYITKNPIGSLLAIHHVFEHLFYAGQNISNRETYWKPTTN